MVGLFKKLSKKKRRDRKGLHSASEDESCTEDESSDKLSYLNQCNLKGEASQEASNGIRSVTPNSCGQTKQSDSCSEAFSTGRSSFASSTGSPGEERQVSFDVGNIDKIVDSLDIDDTLSVTSADEGSLFDEDILSQFQDGQISLQQFLQSPHLSRSEERIRDEEIDSMFSDARSVESSNFYSDSSSGSDHTEKRDQELDRIAGEMFGDYGEKFANTNDRFSIQKTTKTTNMNNEEKCPERKPCRDSYYSIGDETITNSIDNLTVCNDSENPITENNESRSEDFKWENLAMPTPKEVSSDNFKQAALSKVSIQPSSCSAAQLNIQASSCVDKTSTDDTTVSLNQSSQSPDISSSLGAVCNAYTPRRVPVTFPDNLPISPVTVSPINGLNNSPTNETTSIAGLIDQRDGKRSILDHIHDCAKKQEDLTSKRKDTPIDLNIRTLTPTEFLEQRDSVSCTTSRPTSAQSQVSQREVAIVDNVVVSHEGNYMITSDSKRNATPVRGKSPRAEEKVDPWLSYLPKWKATSSTENSPVRDVASANEAEIALRNDKNYAGEEVHRPASAVPPKLGPKSNSLSDHDRFIRFSSLDIDFFIPPPPVDEDTISTAQEIHVDATPFNLEWDYEISDSPTLTPSSSVIFLGTQEGRTGEIDPIAESLLGLLPIQHETFETAVSGALGEIITEIISSRQKFAKLTKVLEFQDLQLREQKKLIHLQTKELTELKHVLASKQPLKMPSSPRAARRNEFKSYPATGRRSKELVDLENTLDKLLFQCHTLQRNSKADPDLQVFQPIDRAEATSRAGSYVSDDGSTVEVKTLLHKKMPDSPANHVQIVPAKGVVYKSCKETKEDLNAIEK